MSAFMFIIKSLVLTGIVVVLLQIKVGNTTLETVSYQWLKQSQTSIYIQSVAAGGAQALRNLFQSVKNGATGTVDSFRQGAEAQAGR